MKKIFYSLLGLTAIVFSSCIKESSLPERFEPVDGNSAKVKFLMMSPDAPQVNFYANGVKSTAVAPTTAGLVQGVVFPSVLPASVGYTFLPAGSIKIEAIVAEASPVTPGAVIYTDTRSLDANKFYTYAIMDSVSKISSVLVEDDPSIPDQSKAYIRIGNFVSNGPAIKVEIVKTSTGTSFSKVYPAVPFKSVTAFEAIDGGSGEVYKVYLRNPTTDAKLDSISAFTPTNSKKYTIYSRGVHGLTGTNAKRPIITSYTNF